MWSRITRLQNIIHNSTSNEHHSETIGNTLFAYMFSLQFARPCVLQYMINNQMWTHSFLSLCLKTNSFLIIKINPSAIHIIQVLTKNSLFHIIIIDLQSFPSLALLRVVDNVTLCSQRQHLPLSKRWRLLKLFFLSGTSRKYSFTSGTLKQYCNNPPIVQPKSCGTTSETVLSSPLVLLFFFYTRDNFHLHFSIQGTVAVYHFNDLNGRRPWIHMIAQLLPYSTKPKCKSGNHVALRPTPPTAIPCRTPLKP